MPLRGPPCRVGTASCSHQGRPGAFRVEDAVPGRDYACHLRAAGFYVQDVRYAAGAGMRRSGHREAGGAGAQAPGQPDPLPRGIRSQQPLPYNDYLGQAWQRRKQRNEHPSHRTRRPQPHGTARCDDLGTQVEACVQHRYHRMREVPGAGEDHCLYRGSHHHREDPQSPEDQGSQANAPIDPAAATGTALAPWVGAGTGGLSRNNNAPDSWTMRPPGIAGWCADSGGGNGDCHQYGD